MTNVDYDTGTPEANDTDSQAFPGLPKTDDTQHFESRSSFPAATQAFSPDVRSTQSQQRSFTNLAGVDAAATAHVENMSDIEEEIVTCQSLADDNKVEMRVIRRSGGTGSDSSLVWHSDDVTALDHTQRNQPEQVKPAPRQKAKKTKPEGKRKRKRKSDTAVDATNADPETTSESAADAADVTRRSRRTKVAADVVPSKAAKRSAKPKSSRGRKPKAAAAAPAAANASGVDDSDEAVKAAG